MAESQDHKNHITRTALGIVTDMYHQPEDGIEDFASTELARIILEDDIDDVDLVIGLLNIATYMLVLFEKEGRDAEQVLAHLGKALIRD